MVEEDDLAKNLTEDIRWPTDATKTAECRFLRAMQYYLLMDAYGNVPFSESMAKPDQYAVLVREFCEQQFVSKGMIADFAIHDPHPLGHNPHAHVLLTMRAMDEHGKWLPKSRKVYDLDENGERIKLPSGRWKSHKEDTVDWNATEKKVYVGRGVKYFSNIGVAEFTCDSTATSSKSFPI